MFMQKYEKFWIKQYPAFNGSVCNGRIFDNNTEDHPLCG